MGEPGKNDIVGWGEQFIAEYKEKGYRVELERVEGLFYPRHIESNEGNCDLKINGAFKGNIELGKGKTERIIQQASLLFDLHQTGDGRLKEELKDIKFDQSAPRNLISG